MTDGREAEQPGWRDLRGILDEESRRAKSSQEAVIKLSHGYGELGPKPREAVDETICEWLLSDDETLRFDALALVNDHGIARAEPVLARLADRLRTDSRPGAPYELRKVIRIRDKLAGRD
jgi:hypothetical protein